MERHPSGDYVRASDFDALAARVQAAEASEAAIRELMNVYNLGGWTDAVAPMKRALAAEAERDAAQADAARYRWLKANAYASNLCSVAWNKSRASCATNDVDRAIDIAMQSAALTPTPETTP
jgi:hypothetical protein